MCVSPPLCEGTTPTTSSTHYRKAETLYRGGDYQSAANEFREALNGDLQPKSVVFWAHIGLGKVFAITEQWDRAGNEFSQALAVQDPTDDSQFQGLVDLAAMAKRLGGQDPSNEPLRTLTPPPKRAEPVETFPTDYSDEARIAELEGTVYLQATVGDDGVPRDFTVYRSLGLGLDEKAIESAKQWLFPTPPPNTLPLRESIAVDFLMEAKSSRWHLIGARFDTPEGVDRPTFLKAKYPIGAGIFTRAAVEEGRVLGAMGRQATATVSFDINERGIPVDFTIDWMSEKSWGPEAVALINEWRFSPGIKDGKPVRTHATFDLLWGPRNLSARTIQINQSAIANKTPLKDSKLAVFK